MYIKDTLEMKRIMGWDGMNTMRTYVDPSYASHSDMRGHTGGLISLGRGTVQAKSSKQKLNTKSLNIVN